jgi:hypothetical protein
MQSRRSTSPSPKANERAREAAGCVCAKAGGLDDHDMETAGHRRPCLLDHQRHRTELPEQDMLEQGASRRNGTSDGQPRACLKAI